MGLLRFGCRPSTLIDPSPSLRSDGNHGNQPAVVDRPFYRRAEDTFPAGAGVRHFGSIGTPVALTGNAFAIGPLLTPLGEGTCGHPLPS